MLRPDIDGRLAERVREIADSRLPGPVPHDEQRRILHVAADLLEEYIMDKKGRTAKLPE